MRRGVLISGLAVTGVVAVGLYSLSYEVQRLDSELKGLGREIMAEHEAIEVLRAEWAYLNQPAVLERSANRHLSLGPIAPGQIASLGELPVRPGPAPTQLIPYPRAKPVRQAAKRVP